MKPIAVVIIPTYNERENIQVVIPKLLAVFKEITNYQMEILVVDDTSPDKTYQAVQQIAEKNDQVHLLINPTKSGLGGAYLKGMAEAFGQLGAEVVFEFDADLSHDPTKIPEFLAQIDRGYDMVLGSRYIPGGAIPSNWGLHRKFLSVFGNLVISAILMNFSIRDWTGGYRAITKKVYQKVLPVLNNERFSGYTFQIGFLHEALKQNFKVAEVPFKFVDRTRGKSKLGPEYIKNTLAYILKFRIKVLLANKLFKFLVVGGVGTLVQLISLVLYWRLMPELSFLSITSFMVATFLSIETAIVSNFFWNNIWTFADVKISLKQVPVKFLQFNLASFGSVVIQMIIATGGQKIFGIFDLFVVPIINFSFNTGLLYVMIGIVTGLFWNFFAYNRFVWKKSKQQS